MNGKTLEQQAVELANDPTRLKARLLEARVCLKKEYARYFKVCMFDLKNWRIVGMGYILQWMTREYPWLPESYDNQQTSSGYVALYKMATPEEARVL